MTLHRDIAEAAAKAGAGRGGVQVGNVTRVGARSGLVTATVNGRTMWVAGHSVAVGDRVAYWDGKTAVLIGPLLEDS